MNLFARFALLPALSLCSVAACGDDEPGADDDDSEQTDASVDGSAPGEDPPGLSKAGEQACGAISGFVAMSGGVCGEPLPCDHALAADCHEVAGVVSEPFLDALAGCVDGEHSPTGCVIDALGELEPTQAHLDFAARFCDECALDVPGCVDAFYFDEDGYGIGTVLLPFGDSFVSEIAEACTESFFCATELPSCVQEQLIEVVELDQTRECLVDTLTDPAELIDLIDGC